MIPFTELLYKRRGSAFEPPERLLALDPGHTTGWAVFEGGEPTASGQVATEAEGWECIYRLFQDTNPTMVVYENYRIYAHKLARHSNSEVYTLRLIGAIEFICEVLCKIPYYNRMAQEAKGFVTDEKLKKWGYYKTGEKHARDAIRHGCYFLLFDKRL